MVQSEKLKALIKGVKEESTPAVKLANELVEEYVAGLDEAMRELEVIMDSIGESSLEEIPDNMVEYYCVKIPSLMYYAGCKVEELGMQADLASSSKKTALNEALLSVSGTVAEKRARAEQLAEDKVLVEAVYKRAYNTLKTKLEMAEKVYSGLKKALSKRISESDLDRFSKDSYKPFGGGNDE